ncbi:hypothetical protein CIB95_14890 [Lottiidibacillus patelloidae]|uniref:LTD domain-containing protein n=1 Tax=Lottiidibacillus patelloidae TaxID=2670334 RepID=A0A263BRW7_9BACI|nr:CehA/McbA family metallohydrolase [Lottiidibacillus patelloidae]OZM55946.1 hypothetical protein CIB95_14890 [Lottiidibacillus patelloidae]
MNRFYNKNRKWFSMFMVVLMLLSMLPAHPLTTQNVQAIENDLFFSEYIEGSSNNKAIEIYNGTGSDVDLSEYTIERYNNGATDSPNITTLEGTLVNGDVYVIANAGADQAILDVADITSAATYYNGDDVLILKHNDTIIDVIGKLGEDPGSEWGTGDVTTKEHTLVRKSSITSGDTNASDDFDPATEWDGYAQNTFDYLGSHSVDAVDSTLTIAEARNADAGVEVSVEGIVTFNESGNKMYIQDDTAGIKIDSYGSDPAVDLRDYAVGSKLKVTGTIGSYKGELLIVVESAESIEVISEGNDLPEAKTITLSQLEDHQGQLVKVNGAIILDTESYNFLLQDSSASANLYHKKAADFDTANYANGEVYVIEGIASTYYENLQITLLNGADMVNMEAMPISMARVIDEGLEVTVQGMITFNESATAMYIQDGTAGIKIDTYGKNVDLTPFTAGSIVKVTGNIDAFRDELEVSLEDIANIEVISEGLELPEPITITLAELADYPGELVKVLDVTINEFKKYSFAVEDSSGESELYHSKANNFDSANYNVGEVYDIIGLGNNYYETPQLKLRDGADMIVPAAEETNTTDIAAARVLDAGTEVTVEGIVTHTERDTLIYIQDATAGIRIDTYSSKVDLSGYNLGDKIRVTGIIGENNADLLLDVATADTIEVINTGNDLPEPVSITIDQVADYQGSLVKLDLVQLTDTSDNYSFYVTDMEDRTTAVYFSKAENFNKADFIENRFYSVIGISAAYKSPQVKLRDGADMTEQEAPVDPNAKLPLIYNLSPAKMSSTKDVKPTISAKFEETEAAIDWTSFVLHLDGTDVTADASVDAENFTFTYTPATDLAYGEHSLYLEIADVNGQKVSVISHFYVQKDSAEYNYYFGVPHAHTGFSDGKGTPADAFEYAYNNGLDYLIVTDHSNWLDDGRLAEDKSEFIGEAGSEWHETGEMINAFNEAHAGEFLAMRGFEMTSSSWGHANVWNSENYVEAKKQMTQLADFYNWLTEQENVVAAFNHPNWPSDSFNDLSYVPEVDHMMSMIEIGNGAPPYSYARAEEHFFKAMDNGWHVGAINGQDNHSTNWGDPDNLTAVVAEDLSNEAFMEAVKNRRVYSTEARDTKLRVKANGFWMGSTLEVEEGEALEFDIWVQDNDDPIDQIQLITNGGTIIDTIMAGGATEFTWNPTVTPEKGANWYVVKVIHSNSKWTTASAIFTAAGENDVKLTGLLVNPDPSLPGAETTLTAQISNMGIRSVENLEVKFYRSEVSEENYIGTGTLGYIAPGKSGVIDVAWIPEKSGQDRIIAVLTEIEGVTTVTEMAKNVKVVSSNGKKVLIDMYHKNYDAPGAMNDFMELLRRNGYSTDLNNAPFTAESLAGYDTLVITTPTKLADNLSADEMKAVSDWVQAGGSLMLSAKSNYSFADNGMLNGLLEEMNSGIRINSDNVYEPNTSEYYSGGMKWSVYAYTMPDTPLSNINDNMEALRFFSSSSLVDENLQALTNDLSTGLEILVAGNESSYNYNVAEGYYTYNEAIGGEDDENQTSGDNGEAIPLVAKELIGEGRIMVAGRHFYSDYEIVNDVSNTSFTLRAIDWLAGYDRIENIGDVRETAEEGDIVTVQGVVTAPTGEFFDTVYIQDETGGIALYGPQGKDLPVGTVVIATGGVTFFEGEMELAFEDFDMEILYVGEGTIVEKKIVDSSDVDAGTYNGQLVQMTGTITEINDSGSYMLVEDCYGDAYIHTDGYLPLGLDRFEVGDQIDVAGIASSGAAGNRIRVRFAEDLAMNTSEIECEVEEEEAPKKVTVTPQTVINSENKEMTATISADDVNKVADGGTVVINPENAKDQNKLVINLKNDLLVELNNSNATLQIGKGDSSVSIPAAIIAQLLAAAGSADITITLEKKVAEGALGAVYDFTITIGSTQVTDFDGHVITLSFEVNQELITDVEATDIKVFYYNETTSEWELVSGSSYDSSTGFAQANVGHFSTFGVFANSDDETPINAGEPELPNTATSMYDMLLYGFALLVIGAVIFVVARRKNSLA